MSTDRTIERRAHVRRKSYLGGKVGNDALQPLSCVVRDLTADGARLEYPANTYLPDKFRLQIPSKDCWLRARVIWRNSNIAGVYFDGFELGAIDPLPDAAIPTGRSLPN